MHEAVIGEQEIKFDVADATINSGLSFAYVPEKPYQIIIDEIKKDKEC